MGRRRDIIGRPSKEALKGTTVADTQNPYSPPKSDISIAPDKSADAKRVFSPAQGGIGTFVGGPIAGTYFLRANFQALGDAKRARLTTVWGVVVCVLILLVLPFLP
jgi:hypothetical protein